MFDKILNRISIKPSSSSIIINLYALVNGTITYPIAQKSAYLNFNDIQPGNLTFNLTITNDTTKASTAKRTLYKFSILPTHPIPSSSAIRVRFPALPLSLSQGACNLTGLSPHFVTSATCNVTGRELLISSPFGSADLYKNTIGPLTFIYTQDGTFSPVAYPLNNSKYFVETLYSTNDGLYPIDASTSIKIIEDDRAAEINAPLNANLFG